MPNSSRWRWCTSKLEIRAPEQLQKEQSDLASEEKKTVPVNLPKWVADADSSAKGINFAGVEAQFANIGKANGTECLIQFPMGYFRLMVAGLVK